MRVLAIGAHPDDLEILCAGTLARFVRDGHDVVMAHASVGDKGHSQIPHAEVPAVRRQEARAAAEVIGAESVTLGFRDGEIAVDGPNLERVVELIRETRPDLILTHHPDDYHGDHQATTKLVVDASFLATLPYFPGERAAHDVACPIFFMDTLAGIDFEPSEYVDVGATIEAKKEAMRCHTSQVTWLSEHHETDVLDLIDTTARFRGLQCGVRHAEGFRRLRAWGRMSTRRLLP